MKPKLFVMGLAMSCVLVFAVRSARVVEAENEAAAVKTSPAEGYTVRQAVLSASPGTKVTLAVHNAVARLRWCELVCC